MNKIEISGFKTVYTNADHEDIPADAFVELKNLKPTHGKLVKTFGLGGKINSAIPVVANNIFVFYHYALSGGYVILAVYVNPSKAVTVYKYDASSGWSVAPEFNGFYHKADFNPIIANSDILRILPGNTGKPDGTNEAKGIWYGYINRVFFDGLHNPGAAFSVYPTAIESPSLTITQALLDNGPFNPDNNGETKYYKFSYVYEDGQESLLSANHVRVDFGQNQLVKFKFPVTPVSHNKRITRINIYRASDPSGSFKYIHQIDFLRPSGGSFRSKSGGAWNGRYYAYIPELTTYNFNPAYTYKLVIDGVDFEIDPPTGTGHERFKLKGAGSASGDEWDEDWALWHDPAAGVTWADTGVGNTSGAFIGEHVVITTTNMSGSDLKARYLLFNETYWRNIVDNKLKAILFKSTEANLGTDTAERSWAVVWDSSGVYFVDDVPGDTIEYSFFDRGFPEYDIHPLINEASIKVNGKYAMVINGRLWLANLVLDPGGANEVIEDGFAWSLPGQYDVIPASNTMRFEDIAGGPITGLAEMFNEPVFSKRESIARLITSITPWKLVRCSHKIGNVATRGFIGDHESVYACSIGGIYRLRLNNFAESDMTPTENLRVSEIINDQYMALSPTEKAATLTAIDKLNDEIIFRFGTDEE